MLDDGVPTCARSNSIPQLLKPKAGMPVTCTFQVRTYAAAALAALPHRPLYGGMFTDALLVVCGALEGLQSGGGSGAGIFGMRAGTAAPSSAAAVAAGAAPDEAESSSGREGSSAALGRAAEGAALQQAETSVDAGEGGRVFSNFR